MDGPTPDAGTHAAWLDAHGFDAGTEIVSVRDATRAGVAERTLRRYISDGILPTVRVRGRRGEEHRIRLTDLHRVITERSSAIERVQVSPVDELAAQVQALRAVIEEQNRTMDELRAEVRDSRAQLHQMHEQVVRALMPPASAPDDRPWWKRILGR